MADIPSHDSQPGLGLSSPAGLELSEELYLEFLGIKQMEELAGRPIPEMTEICRRMTPQQKLKTAERMFWDVRRGKVEAVQREHPDWSAEQVNGEVSRMILAESVES